MSNVLFCVDWSNELINESVEEMWNFIRLKYNEPVDQRVPCIGSRKKKKSNFISKETLKLISQK